MKSRKTSIQLVSLAIAIGFLLITSCSDDDNDSVQEVSNFPSSYVEILNLKKDKARYNPGEQVDFTVSSVHPNTLVRYKYLGETVHEEPLAQTAWSWQPPSEDFKGYMVELVKQTDGEETILGTVGVDVSSDWTKFPRYGFLSDFGNISESQRSSILNNLKDYQINGLQYYDWLSKHHIPLPLDDAGAPLDQWTDLFNREIKFNTVKGYIDEGHDLNMASMFYDLLYGAWNPESGDGFQEDWVIFNDQFHNDINRHDHGGLGSIWVTDPNNSDWQDYIFSKTEDVYNNLDFDGWHLDQLGDRGNVYTYGGYQVNMRNGFHNFLNELTAAFPDKKHVLNAVAQYGQSEILSTPMDFAYTEVWTRSQYADLAQVILENYEMSNGNLNTVLAAYMNYNASEGYFNTPSVLMTDAVIFAFGGDHLELGEHMLSKEYFPYNNLAMDDELKSSLKEYYDFVVAYENILRDGGNTVLPEVSSPQVGINNWPPVFGNISVVGKQFDNRESFQLINFNGVATLDWRDNNRVQTQPTSFSDLEISIHSNSNVSKVWFASPDYNGGASQELEFQNTNGQVTFKIPYLSYWSMVVFEN